jgi:type IV secretory pathway VirB2 component (pilin)
MGSKSLNFYRLINIICAIFISHFSIHSTSRLIMKVVNKLSQLILFYVLSMPAMATSGSSSGTDLPWEGPLDKILQSVQGPVARVFILLAIIATGVMMAFGEHGSGMKKVMGIAFGGSIVLGATSFVSTLFGASF